jgi:hypothetical protein
MTSVIQTRRSVKISFGPSNPTVLMTLGINWPMTIRYEHATPKHLATMARSIMIYRKDINNGPNNNNNNNNKSSSYSYWYHWHNGGWLVDVLQGLDS